MCPYIDFYKSNQITVKNQYLLPLIPDLLSHLQGTKFLTKLDLREAYNFIRIRQVDKWKTVFDTTEHFVMLFDLGNSPAAFQNFANYI